VAFFFGGFHVETRDNGYCSEPTPPLNNKTYGIKFVLEPSIFPANQHPIGSNAHSPNANLIEEKLANIRVLIVAAVWRPM
jgi:hypothetical protein